jgi:hypothetical protein
MPRMNQVRHMKAKNHIPSLVRVIVSSHSSCHPCHDFSFRVVTSIGGASGSFLSCVQTPVYGNLSEVSHCSQNARDQLLHLLPVKSGDPVLDKLLRLFDDTFAKNSFVATVSSTHGDRGAVGIVWVFIAPIVVATCAKTDVRRTSTCEMQSLVRCFRAMWTRAHVMACLVMQHRGGTLVARFRNRD